MTSPKPGFLVPVLAAGLLCAALPARAAADGPADPLANVRPKPPPIICHQQTYGLCAGANCFVFNKAAYCKCDVMEGKSISARFKYDGGNICKLNAEGAENGYIASTFSLPDALRAPHGTEALYTCPLSSDAAYAKCDGGICFRSTQGKSFPGLGQLGADQLVCSCPTETASARHGGLEIIGPYPCQQAFFANCDRAVANTKTGTTLYDGTGIGATVAAIQTLYGHVPKLNVCN